MHTYDDLISDLKSSSCEKLKLERLEVFVGNKPILDLSSFYRLQQALIELLSSSSNAITLLYTLHPLVKHAHRPSFHELQIIIQDPFFPKIKTMNYVLSFLSETSPVKKAQHQWLCEQGELHQWPTFFRSTLLRFNPQTLKLNMATQALGLEYEGLMPNFCLQASMKRWHDQGQSQILNLHWVNFTNNIPELQLKIRNLEHGKYLSLCFYANTPSIVSQYDHLASLHLIRDQEHGHLIWLNRGDKFSSTPFFQTKNLLVFTLPYTLIIKESPLLLQTLAQGILSSITSHLERKFLAYFNADLSAALAKTTQKVGNCGFANTNFCWHLHLSSQVMQGEKKDLLYAYMQSKPLYQALRMQDQIKAFRYILKNTERHSHSFYYLDALCKILVKFFRKDETKLSYIQASINALGSLEAKLYHDLRSLITLPPTKEKPPLSLKQQRLMQVYKLHKACHGSEVAEHFLREHPSLDQHKNLRKWSNASTKTSLEILGIWQSNLEDIKQKSLRVP